MDVLLRDSLQNSESPLPGAAFARNRKGGPLIFWKMKGLCDDKSSHF